MLKRLSFIGCLTLVLAAVAVPAHADTRVSINIGTPVRVARVPVAPVVVAPPPYRYASPYPGYVWQPAHYVRARHGWQWMPGAWMPAPYYAPNAYYAPQVPYYAPPVVVGPRVGVGVSISSRGRRR